MPDLHNLKTLVTHLEAEWEDACTLANVLHRQADEASRKAGVTCDRLRSVRDAMDILERRS